MDNICPCRDFGVASSQAATQGIQWPSQCRKQGRDYSNRNADNTISNTVQKDKQMARFFPT